MDELAQQLLDNGVLGVALVAVGYAYWQEKKETKRLNEKLLEVSSSFYEKYVTLATEVTKVMSSFTDALDKDK